MTEILTQTDNTIIVALSDTEIGKVILPNNVQFVDAKTGKPVDLFGDTMPTLKKEMAALQYANSVNDLMPQFIKTQTWQSENGAEYDMMVMERLYPLPFNHFDVPMRETMMSVFEKKLVELHKNQFVHGDLVRPTNFFTRGNKAWMFSNVIQTQNGLRLIDAGFGTICNNKNIDLYVSILMRERLEIEDLKAYYLSC
jgi:hypothetical protein